MQFNTSPREDRCAPLRLRTGKEASRLKGTGSLDGVLSADIRLHVARSRIQSAGQRNLPRKKSLRKVVLVSLHVEM